MRFISLMDGTEMGDMLLIFKTDAPVEELKELERISNEVYLNSGDYDDIPIWSYVLKQKGYKFNYIDEHRNVTAYGTSGEWLKEKYPHIEEHYCIKNQ